MQFKRNFAFLLRFELNIEFFNCFLFNYCCCLVHLTFNIVKLRIKKVKSESKQSKFFEKSQNLIYLQFPNCKFISECSIWKTKFIEPNFYYFQFKILSWKCKNFQIHKSNKIVLVVSKLQILHYRTFYLKYKKILNRNGCIFI